MPFPAPRRHSTVPTSFQPAPPRNAPTQTTAASVETLFSHPSVKIIAFSAGKSAFDKLGSSQGGEPGSLQPSSQFERTIAIGTFFAFPRPIEKTTQEHAANDARHTGGFQIYRAPGSVAFLRSGPALQPILPKSQCWCLDEQSSKFVLQIRRPNYWRIEVPIGNQEEIRRALVLREVLDRILQLEKTPCPFERSFTVELPERPKTPPKKRPWTPTAPTRSVSMNWPPGQPVTPPPEFPTRGRFYNPNARRFSDFGVDTSKTSSTLGTPPRKPEKRDDQQEAEEHGQALPRRSHVEAATMILEEPELLSPPPTAIPPSVHEVTKEAVSPVPATTTSQGREAKAESSATSAQEQPKTEIPVRSREPFWITKKVPSSANRKAKRAAPKQSISVETKAPTVQKPQSSLAQTKPKQAASQEGVESESSATASKTASPNDSTDDSETSSGAMEGSGQLRVRRTRVAAFASRRAATVPPLRLRTSSISTSSSTSDTKAEKINEKEVPEPNSPAESLDSFHSMESHQSWHSPISPPPDLLFSSPTKTYPYPHDNVPLAPHIRRGQMSDFTTTPTAAGWERNSVGAVVGSGPNTPNTPFTEFHDEEHKLTKEGADGRESPKESNEAAIPIPVSEDATDAPSENNSLASSWSSAASWSSSRSNAPMRHRAATTSVAVSHTSPRALFPLPPAANLLLVDPVGRASTAVRAIRRIPSSIFNKTCEILISPPAHLISLMLKAAARITAGEWRGFVFGMDEGGELVDIRWDWSDDGDIGGLILEGWDESDFDLSNTRRQSSNSARKSRVASFTAAELPRHHRPSPSPRAKIEYQDPWATPPDEPDLDEEEHWSRSWGVD